MSTFTQIYRIKLKNPIKKLFKLMTIKDTELKLSTIIILLQYGIGYN